MRLAIYGSGGHGRDILPIVEAGSDVVFVSDVSAGAWVGDVPVLSYEQLLSPEHADRKVVVARGDPATRRSIVTRLTADGRLFASLAAATVRIYGS
jgi:hypothetical protein